MPTPVFRPIFACFIVFTLLYPILNQSFGATVAIGGKEGWTAIMYGTNQDPAGDSQAGAADTDIVGDDFHGSLYTAFDDNNTPSPDDDSLLFRLRIDNPTSLGNFRGVAVVGMDANGDGRIDLFMQVDARNNGRVVRLMDPGTDANISPNTTSTSPLPPGWLPNNGIYPFTAHNFNSTVVTSATDPHWNGNNDLGNDGKIDAFVSWRIPIKDIAAVLAKPSPRDKNGVYGPRGPNGIPGFTKDTLVRYVAFTQTQSGPINGDLLGVPRHYDRNATFDSLGTMTPPMSASQPVAAGPRVTISTPISGGTINSVTNSNVTVSGTSGYLDGRTLTLSITDGTTTVVGNALIAAGGAWSVTGLDLSGLSDGILTVTASATTEAGVTVTDVATVLHDATPPSVTINPLLANSAEHPVISGTSNLPNGSVITILIDPDNNPGTGFLTYQVVVMDGEWTLDLATTPPLAGTMPSGGLTSYAKITALATDAAGNTASVDALNPPTARNVSTNNTTPVLSGTWTNIPGDELRITIEGSSAVYLLSPTGNFWSLDLATATPVSGTLSPLLPGNTYEITASVHRGTESAAGTGVLEITTAPVVAVGIDGGETAFGSDPFPVITGTSQNAGGFVIVRLDPGNDGDLSDAVTFSVPTDESGNWSLNTLNAAPISGIKPPAGFLGDTGVRATDSTGEVSAHQILSITVPTVSITSILSTAVEDSFGIIDNSPGTGDAWLNRTEATSVAISGTSTGGSSVDLVIRDGAGQFIAVDDIPIVGGEWSVDGLNLLSPLRLSDGVLTVTATLANTVISDENQSVTLDTVPLRIFNTTPNPIKRNQSNEVLSGLSQLPVGTSVRLRVYPTNAYATVHTNGGHTFDYTLAVGSGGNWSQILANQLGNTSSIYYVDVRPSVQNTDTAGNITQPLRWDQGTTTGSSTTGTIAINIIAGDDSIEVGDISPLIITGTVSGSDLEGAAASAFTLQIWDGFTTVTADSFVKNTATTWTATLNASTVQALSNGSLVVTVFTTGLSTNFTGIRAAELFLANPVLTITDDAPSTITGSVTYTFTFSEPVSGFTADDVIVTNGTKGVFSGSGDTYTLVVEPADDATGILSVVVDAGAGTGQATGRPSTPDSSSKPFDTTGAADPPEITIDTTGLATSRTPLITGTTDLSPGAPVLIQIDLNNDGVFDLIYSVTVQLGGVWSLNIDTATPETGLLPEGGLDPWARVVATATNAFDVSTSVTGLNKPVVSFHLTNNNNTPTVSGFWTEVDGDVLDVLIEVGPGDFVGGILVSGPTWWTLTVDPAYSFDDGVYDVIASVTRGAETVFDLTENELQIDTFATVSIHSPTGTIGNPSPVISGSSDGLPPGTVLILELDLNGDGNPDLEYRTVIRSDLSWSVDTGVAIPSSGTFPGPGLNGLVHITARATDPAGNIATDEREVTIKTSAEIAFTTNPSTRTTTPEITGTTDIEPGGIITIRIDSNDDGIFDKGPYTAIVQPDGTWSVTVPPEDALAPGTIVVEASGTDALGNSALVTTNLIVDLSAPSISIATPIDSAGDGDGVLNGIENQAVVISGTVFDIPEGSVIYVAITDGSATIVDTAIVDAFGAWELEPLNLSSLADGVLTVSATYIDNFGAFFNDVVTVVHDQTPPLALLSTTNTSMEIVGAGPEQFTVTFSEPVTGLIAEDFAASNGASVTDLFYVGDNVYTFNLVPSVNGSVTVWLPSARVVDLAGNTNLISNLLTFTVSGLADDEVPPTVISISREEPVAEVTNANTVVFRVTFSEAVTGVTTDSFDLVAAGGGGTPVISSVTGVLGTEGSGGSFLQFDVTVDGLAGYDGPLAIGVGESHGILDTATIPNPLVDRIPNETEGYLIDTTPPVVDSGSGTLSGSTVSFALIETGSGLASDTPSPGSFWVTVTPADPEADPFVLAVASVSVIPGTNTVSLALISSVAYDDQLQLTYAPPGTNALRDVAGNLADGFTIPLANHTPVPDTTPPMIDLDPSSGGSDYAATSPGGAAVLLSNPDPANRATLVEDSGWVTDLFITVGGLLDGGDEQLLFDGEPMAADGSSTFLFDVLIGGVRVNVTHQAGAFVIQKFDFSPMTDSEAQAVLRTIEYRNLAGPATPGLRTFVFQAEDPAGNRSAGAEAAITIPSASADAAASTLLPLASSIGVGGYTQVLIVTANDGGGSPMGTGGAIVTITLASGSGSIGTVTDHGDGTYSATVTSPDLIGSGVFEATLDGQPVQNGGASQTEAVVTYVAGPAAQLVFINDPFSGGDSIAAGTTTPGNLVLQLQDQFGNPVIVTDPAGLTITLGTGSPLGEFRDEFGLSIFPAEVVIIENSSTVTFRYYDERAGTHTLTASSAGLTDGTQPVEVTPAALAGLVLTLPGETFGVGTGNSGNPTARTAGEAFDLEIRAVDAFGNIVTSYDGEKTLQFSGASASPNGGQPQYPATVTFTNGVAAGPASAETILYLAETLQLTATEFDGPDPVVSGTSSEFDVVHGTVAGFLVEADGGGPIGTQTSGEGFALQITARDAYGNTVTDFTGTVDLTLNQGGFVSGGGTTPTFVNGVLTGHAVAIEPPDTGYVITVTRTGQSETGDSNAFDVVTVGDPIASLSGSSVRFDPTGNGTGMVPFNAGLNPERFTLEAWVKVRDGAGTRRDIVGSLGSNRGFMLVAGANDQWQFWIGNGFGYAVVDSGVPIVMDSWTHLAGTFEGMTARLYVDGELAASVVTALWANTSEPFAAAPGAGFDGDINDVRFWNVARTAEQVDLLHRTRLNGHEFGLVGHWRFDEGSGTTVVNSAVAAPANTGMTLTGTIEWLRPLDIPLVRVLALDGLETEIVLTGYDPAGNQVDAYITAPPAAEKGKLFRMLANGDRGEEIELVGGTPVLIPEGRVLYLPLVGPNPDPGEDIQEGFDAFEYYVESLGIQSNVETVTVDLLARSILGGTALHINSSPGSNQYVRTPNVSGLFQGNTAVTIEIWFRADGPGVLVTELGQETIDRGWQNSQLEVVDIGGGQAEVRARVWNLPEADANTLVNGITLGSITYGEWNHAAVRYNPLARRVDGSLNGVISGSVSGDRLAPWEVIIVDNFNQAHRPGLFYAFGAEDRQHLGSGQANVGQFPADNFFQGVIDEVRIWHKAVADDRLQQGRFLYLNGTEEKLALLYRFDEASGATVRNSAVANPETPTDATIFHGGERVESFADLNMADTIRSAPVVVELPGFHEGASLSNAFITELPLFGALYQYGHDGATGARIATVPAEVTDSRRRVIFVPAGGGYFDRLGYETRFSGEVFGPRHLRFRVKRVNERPNVVDGLLDIAAVEGTPLEIRHADLLAAVGEPGSPLTFRIERILLGELTKDGTPVVSSVTMVGPGESVFFTPPPYVNNSNNGENGGEPLAAFRVVAFDGRDYSENSAVVRVNVDPAPSDPVATFPGTVLRLNGNNQFVFTRNVRPLFRQDDLTIEVWFRVEAGGGGVLISERTAANLSGWSNSQLEVAANGQVRARIPGLYSMTPVVLGTVEFGTWNHAVVRYDRANEIFDGFLNGVRAQEIRAGKRLTPWSSGNFTGLFYGIGLRDSSHLGNGEAFQGEIREVRMWNIARNTGSIRTSYPGSLTGNEIGLAGWFRFDEGEGIEVVDHGPFELNASLVNGPEWMTGVRVDPNYLKEIRLEGFHPDGRTIEFVITELPKNGFLYQSDGQSLIQQGGVVNGSTLYYSPDVAAGADSFVYRVHDVDETSRMSAEETVHLVIQAVNGPTGLSMMTDEERADVVRVGSVGVVKSQRDLMTRQIAYGDSFSMWQEPVEALQIEFSVEAGRRFVVEYSEDLVHWRQVDEVYSVRSRLDPKRIDGVAEIETGAVRGFMRIRVTE